MPYTAEEVAHILSVPVPRLRSYVRAGFVAPERHQGVFRFSFQDVVLLRTAHALVGARIAHARIKRALGRLRAQLPEGRPITGVAIGAEGNRMVVRDGGTAWNPESGQVLFDFAVAELAERAQALGGERVLALRPPAAAEAESDHDGGSDSGNDSDSAADWFTRGCRHEDDGEVERALAAYLRSLDGDERYHAAHINLGRLLHERGERALAIAHYQRALTLQPDDALAAFNLGVVLEDEAAWAEAAAAYERALVSDPGSADAHYNLSGVYERLGERAKALRHLRAYKELVGR